MFCCSDVLIKVIILYPPADVSNENIFCPPDVAKHMKRVYIQTLNLSAPFQANFCPNRI